MTYARAVRVIAMGILLAAVTACGGSGGSGGDENVSLPDPATARQKALTPDNSKRAVILALNVIGFVEDGTIPASSALDFYADYFSELPVFSKPSRLRLTGSKTVDVSAQICISGTADVEAGDSLIGRMVQRYRNCDVGGAVFDGLVELDIRNYIASDILTDVTFSFRGLRVTTSGEDSQFDGTVAMTTDYPGAGVITADLDIRDLVTREGARVVGYRADFDINYIAPYNSYQYRVNRLEGRIYDNTGEYYDLGLTPGHAPWPMLIGRSSRLTLSPSGMDVPYQVQIALDADGDNAIDHWLFVDLEQLSENLTNSNAPEFHLDASPVRLGKGESREVRLSPVTDADQQFVSIEWSLVEQPAGSDPIVDASTDGFVFSSTIAGDYRVRATASDGEHTTTQELDIRVIHDMPQVSANVPENMIASDSISFEVSILNPEEGNIEIAQLNIPGLTFAASGLATYTPVLPDFGLAQEVTLSFRVRNEDWDRIVSFPVTVRPDSSAVAPLLISGDNYWGALPIWFGNFDHDPAVELIQQSIDGKEFHIFDVDSSGKRYRESLSLALSGEEGTVKVADVVDANHDGVDEVIALQNTPSGITRMHLLDVLTGKSIAVYEGLSGEVSAIAADVDASGDSEIVLFNGVRLVVLDEGLQLVWQTQDLSYSNDFTVGNLDSDPALEIVTETGLGFDGATGVQEFERNLYVSVWELFSADIDGDGIQQAFVVESQLLREQSDSGYVDFMLHFIFNSNVLVKNMDADAADELVGVVTEAGVLKLGYLDFDGVEFDWIPLQELSNAWGEQYKLGDVDIDGDGVKEITGMLQNEVIYGQRTSFVFRQTSNTLQPLSNISGVGLLKFSGGSSISAPGDKLLFCGEFQTGGSTTDDLFTVDIGQKNIDNAMTLQLSTTSGVVLPIRSYKSCYGSSLGKAGRNFVVSAFPVARMNAGFFVALKVQEAQSGAVILENEEMLFDGPVGQVLVADSDLIGDSSAEIVIATDDKVALFDVDRAVKLHELSLGGETIEKLAIGHVNGAQARPVIVLLTNQRVVVIAVGAGGTLQLGRAVNRNEVLGAGFLFTLNTLDVDGNGSDEIILQYVDSVMDSHAYILDSNFATMRQWSITDDIAALKAMRLPDGSRFLASIEGNYPEERKHLVWRDAMTGTKFYQSPDSLWFAEQRLRDFQIIAGAVASDIRVVLTGNRSGWPEGTQALITR